MTKTRSKPRIVREQVGLPDRSLQFKNIDEGYRVFFKVFTTVLATFIVIAGITRPERIPQMQYILEFKTTTKPVGKSINYQEIKSKNV